MRASVVIITKNQRAFLQRSLPVIAAQRGFEEGGLEVIVVDSGSTDGAQEVVRASVGPVRLVEIPPRTFTYARAHNAGAAQAQGDLLVRLSGDAIPADACWLSRLL